MRENGFWGQFCVGLLPEMLTDERSLSAACLNWALVAES